MNVYLIKSPSLRILEEEINKISKTIENKIIFDYSSVNIQTILEECAYFSLMDDKKVVIVYNYKLSASKDFENYLKNPNPNTILILSTDTIDKRTSIYKLIEQTGKIIIIEDLNDNDIYKRINSYILSNNIKIKDNAILKLMEYNDNNYDLILNELDKISLLNQEITVSIIDEYASKIISSNNFKLCDKITNKDFKNIDTEIKLFKTNKEDVIPFIGLLLSQYQIILAVMTMNLNNDDIAKKIGVHPYRVKLAREKSRMYNLNDIKNIFSNLTEIDYKLKSEKIDPYILLENFIIKLM